MKHIGLSMPSSPGTASFSATHTLAALSAWLKRRGDVPVFVPDAFNPPSGLDELWLSGTSDAWNFITAAAEKAVKSGLKTVVGGHHATALPESLPYGEIFSGPIEGDTPLDEIPVPDWETVPVYRRRFPVMTSRGCPYTCRFCSSSSFWGGFRRKSPKVAAAELNSLMKYRPKKFNMFDDLFVSSTEWLEEFTACLRGTPTIRVKKSCLLRVNLIRPSTFSLLRKLNMSSVTFGAESANDRVLELMGKTGVTAKKNQEVIDHICEEGFSCSVSVIVGFPGETLDELHETVEFLKKNRHKAGFSVFPCVPFPGTPLWDWFVTHKQVSFCSGFDWGSLNFSLTAFDPKRYNMLTDEYEVSHIAEAVRLSS